MKKILLFIVLLMGLTLSAPSKESMSLNSHIPANDNLLRRILPDSIYSIVDKRQTLFYFFDGFGSVWSLLTKTDTGFIAFRGVRQSSKYGKDLVEPIGFNQNDSMRFFAANRALFLWGLDTFPKEVSKMEPIIDTMYNPFFPRLILFDSIGIRVFGPDKVIAFSGSDSVTFNDKYLHIKQLMLWLSFPRLREYFVDSVVFGPPPVPQGK